MNSQTPPEALMWGSTGDRYDGISFGLSDTLSHAVQLLWPQPGERVLDICTGTGWTARLAALRGANVTAVDFAPEMVAAAQNLSHHLGDRLTVCQADATSLPFHDESFDCVVSTFGVMFAADQHAAANELLRVLKPGGRMVLANWLADPDGYIARFFSLIGQFSDAPPPPVSPMNWGDSDWLHTHFGHRMAITCRPQTTTLYAPDTAQVWNEYLAGFGPVATTYHALAKSDRPAFREAFEDLHTAYDSNVGLVIKRDALLVKGRKL